MLVLLLATARHKLKGRVRRMDWTESNREAIVTKSYEIRSHRQLAVLALPIRTEIVETV